jgi:long-subunit fatty acid transport protein
MILFFLLFLLYSSASMAAQANPNFLPLGDKEALMSNAGTAGVQSPGSIYYNPAAMTEVGESFSLSGSTYMHFDYEFEPFLRLDDENLDYQASSFVTVPSSVISIKPKGNWTIGYTILVPSSIKIDDKKSYLTGGTSKFQIDITQIIENQELYIGLAAAKRVNDKLSLGAALYGVHFSESKVVVINNEVKAVTGIATSEQERITLDAYMLRLALGAQYVHNEHKFGLRVFTPSVLLRSRADFYDEELVANQFTPLVTVKSVDQEVVEGAQYRYPWDIMFGHSWKRGRWQLATDLGVQLPIYYRKLPRQYDTGGNLVDYDAAPRVRFGVEYQYSTGIQAYLGLGYSPSAVEDYRNPLTESPNDFYNLSLGGRWTDGQLTTGFGVFYSDGRGKTVSNIEGDTRFIIVGAMLTSSYRL